MDGEGAQRRHHNEKTTSHALQRVLSQWAPGTPHTPCTECPLRSHGSRKQLLIRGSWAPPTAMSGGGVPQSGCQDIKYWRGGGPKTPPQVVLPLSNGSPQSSAGSWQMTPTSPSKRNGRASAQLCCPSPEATGGARASDKSELWEAAALSPHPLCSGLEPMFPHCPWDAHKADTLKSSGTKTSTPSSPV